MLLFINTLAQHLHQLRSSGCLFIISFQEKRLPAMPKQTHYFCLSRRSFLQSLAAFTLTMGIEACAQSNSTSSASPTPTPGSHRSGKLLLTYRGHKQRPTTVAWSPDGRYIASGSLDETVQIWAANAGEHFHPFIFHGHSAAINSVDWAPDSQRVVSGATDSTLLIWNAFTGEDVISCHGHTGAVTTVAWSPDGKYIASGSADGTVRLWNAVTGAQQFVYHGHTDSVNSVSWSPDSQRLVSGSSDKTVQILDAATGSHVYTYRGHSGTVSSVSWAPDGKRIASGSWDKTVQVWEAATGKVAYIYDGYNVKVAQIDPSRGVLPDLIFVVAWSHNGKRIAAVTQVYCGDNCGVVVTWDADTERNFSIYEDFPIFSLAWSPDDTRFVTAIDVTNQGTEVKGQSDSEAGAYVQISQA
jgi:WD40 repeat protein